jgi:hypothetical protein
MESKALLNSGESNDVAERKKLSKGLMIERTERKIGSARFDNGQLD